MASVGENMIQKELEESMRRVDSREGKFGNAVRFSHLCLVLCLDMDA